MIRWCREIWRSARCGFYQRAYELSVERGNWIQAHQYRRKLERAGGWEDLPTRQGATQPERFSNIPTGK
jgi:hypothetical protein